MLPAPAETDVTVPTGADRLIRRVNPGSISWSGLVWTLVRTDFKVRYHGTWGGFVWALAKPVTMFVSLMAVFSFLFASNPAYKLNLIIGLFLWDFFTEATKSGLGSLDAKRFLLTKARCPSWIVVVTSTANAVITLSVFSAVMVVFLWIFGHRPSLEALVWFAAYSFALLLIVIGFSLAASVTFLRYRDLNQIWDLMIQVGFFIAPIIYPISILPERFHFYLYLWPPTSVIEFSRAVLVQGVIPTAKANLLLTACAVASLVVGAVTFRALAPRSAEYV